MRDAAPRLNQIPIQYINIILCTIFRRPIEVTKKQ